MKQKARATRMNQRRAIMSACHADEYGPVQNEETHPELRKYTEMLRTVAGSKVGSWLGLSAFNQQAAKDKAIADAEGVPWTTLTPCLKIWLAHAAQCVLDALLLCMACTQSLQYAFSCCGNCMCCVSCTSVLFLLVCSLC